MNRQDWEKSKRQIRKLITNGIAEIKELAADASQWTDSTTTVVKLEMDIHRLRTEIDKIHARLGREVARQASPNGAIKSTAQMKRLINSCRALEKKLEAAERKVKSADLSWTSAKKTVAKKIRKPRKQATRRKAARIKKSSRGKRMA